MAEAAPKRAVVWTISVEEILVALAVHHACSRSIFALHPCILLKAGPVHQVLTCLQSRLHCDTGEQIVVLCHQSALHFRFIAQSWLVEVKCAFAHQCLPFLGLVLVITHNLEHFRVLAPGRSSSRVIAGLTLVHV